MAKKKVEIGTCENCDKEFPYSELKECAGSGCAGDTFCRRCAEEDGWQHCSVCNETYSEECALDENSHDCLQKEIDAAIEDFKYDKLRDVGKENAD